MRVDLLIGIKVVLASERIWVMLCWRILGLTGAQQRGLTRTGKMMENTRLWE